MPERVRRHGADEAEGAEGAEAGAEGAGKEHDGDEIAREENEIAREETADEAMTAPRPTVAVGAFVFDRERRLLVVQRGQPPGEGMWSVPGGKQEPGETLAQAVAREVREETGLIVEVRALACVVERIDEHHHYVILDYDADVIGGELAAGSDVRDARFVALEDLEHHNLGDALHYLNLSRSKA